MSCSRVDHGFYGKGHAFFEPHARTSASVMQDLRSVVKDTANAVSAEFLDYREPVSRGMSLDCIADVAQKRACPDGFDASIETLLGNPDQAAGHHRRFADKKHLAGIPVETILDHSDIDIDDVTAFQ